MEKKFDSFSPTDYRYSVEDLKPYLTENSFVKYKARVEAALVKVLAKYAMVTSEIAQEIIQASRAIKPEEVYQEEKRIKHDIRALVNCIRNKVSDQAKPYVHLLATSCDIVDTANVLRYKDAANKVILPEMIKLEEEWIALALREKKTLQIGRTHGQHAEPITFGFALSQYVHRWGGRILYLKEAADNLVGKFSGAVGAYNSSSLFFAHPEKFEKEILQELGLCPALISTQIIPPEPTADFAHALVSAFGVLANFCDDFRHLQRTEIAEVGERFGGEQVGSSTMPQKRNPINFENVKSMWKAFMPRMVTVYSDQISEHQRDLTNSCSQRYFPELLVAFCSSVKRVSRISGNLRVNKKKMEENFKISEKTLIAEPLYILLASFGHPDAHEYVRKLTMECERTGKSLSELAREDKNLQVYLKKLTAAQQEIILNPSKYIGAASSKTEKVVSFWKKRIKKAKL